jgi:hypothetical protein
MTADDDLLSDVMRFLFRTPALTFHEEEALRVKLAFKIKAHLFMNKNDEIKREQTTGEKTDERPG